MLQDDPIRQKKNDRWRQLVDQGMDPNDAYDAVQKEYDVPRFTEPSQAASRPAIQRPAAESTLTPKVEQAKPAPTQFLRSAAQGASLGIADEAEGAIRGVVGAARRAMGMPGETYGEAVEDVRGKLKAFREESPKAAFATEMAGGLLTGGLAGGTKTVIGRALMNPVVSGAISGAAGADGDLMNRVKGAAIGAGAGKVIGTVLTPTRTLQRDVVQDVAAAQSPAGSRIGRALSDLRNKAATGMEKSQRFAADVLENRGFGKVARAIEPVDERTIQRAVNKNLPGTGLTEGAIEQQAQQASSIASRQADIAKAVGDEVQAVQVETVNRGKALAERAREQATARAEGVAERSKALAERAAQQGRARAEQLLAEAKDKASQVVAGVRQRTGTADRVREQIRNKQLADAEQSYGVVRQFGRPDREPVAVYDAITRTPALKSAFDAVTAARTEAGVTRRLARAEGERLFQPLGTEKLPKVPIKRRDGTIEEVPALTLRTMDQMRQHINEKVTAYLGGSKETGITPQVGKKLLKQINVLEDKFLSAYPPEARDAITAARAGYREDFVTLEALRDGLNLGSVKAGKDAKLLSSNPKAFASLAERMRSQYTTPAAREAFRAGGREWFNNLIDDRLDDALKFAQQAIKSDTDRKKIAFVFGKDMVEQMQQIAAIADQSSAVASRAASRSSAIATAGRERAASIAKSGQARAERIASMGEASAEKLGDRLRPEVFGQRDLADVTAEQAKEIANRLAAAKQARSALAPGGREAAASFVDVTLPGLMTEARGTVQDYGASAVQREIAGLDAPAALARLQQLQGNPAARALFGSQLDRTIEELQKRTVGSLVRPALAGAAGRRLGGLFTGRDE